MVETLLLERNIIDGLSRQWIAGDPLPSSSPITPYPTAPTGGYAIPAPNPARPMVGSPTPSLDDVINTQTYVTPTGARAWLPTNYDNELIDTVTRNPYHGMDELLEAAGDRAVANAAGRGAKYLPYVGDIAGGAVEAAAVYGRTGSMTHATFAGGGATIGGIAGTAIGGAVGAVGGPLGVAIGGIVGGAIGSALGSALGQGLANLVDPLFPVNKNGATIDGDPPFSGGQCYGNYSYRFTYKNSQNQEVVSNQTVSGRIIGTYIGTVNAFGNRQVGIKRQVSPGSNITEIALAPVSASVSPNPKISNVQRTDGGLDNCGDPAPEQLTDKPTLTEPRIKADDRELPEPDIDPNLPGLPRFRGLPRGWPTGTQPPPAPDPTIDPGPAPVPTGDPAPVPTGDPAPVPTPDPTGGGGGGGGSGGGGGGDEPCDPCAELKAIRAKLEETYSLAWALPDCGTDFQITRTGEKEGQGLAGLSQKIDGLYQILRVLHDNTRCNNDSFVVVPDSWPMKVEAGRPQLVLIYATKNKDKTWGSRRYEFCIPHFDGKLRKALKSLVPKEIKKGSHQGTYTLADNSKIITYCKTKTEAMRIINVFDKLVLKDMKTTNKKTGEINPNTKFLELTLYPFEARFFSQGQQNPNPDWKDKLF